MECFLDLKSETADQMVWKCWLRNYHEKNINARLRDSMLLQFQQCYWLIMRAMPMRQGVQFTNLSQSFSLGSHFSHSFSLLSREPQIPEDSDSLVKAFFAISNCHRRRFPETCRPEARKCRKKIHRKWI